MHHRAGNVLDPLHQFDELLAIIRFAGGKTNAAIAHDRSGDAVPGRWGRCPIPDCLAVVVGVDIDKARRDDLSTSVDFLGTFCQDMPDFGYFSVGQRDISFIGSTAGSIDDGAVADDDIWLAHGLLPYPLGFPWKA